MKVNIPFFKGIGPKSSTWELITFRVMVYNAFPSFSSSSSPEPPP